MGESWGTGGQSRRGGGGTRTAVQAPPQPFRSLATGSGGGPAEVGDFPLPSTAKEQTQETVMSTGQKHATHERQGGHLPGGAGQEKPDSV